MYVKKQKTNEEIKKICRQNNFSLVELNLSVNFILWVNNANMITNNNIRITMFLTHIKQSSSTV